MKLNQLMKYVVNKLNINWTSEGSARAPIAPPPPGSAYKRFRSLFSSIFAQMFIMPYMPVHVSIRNSVSDYMNHNVHYCIHLHACVVMPVPKIFFLLCSIIL